VRGPDGGDPAAVIHDAINSAVSTGIERVFIDTAGRLHTKEPLMKELDKINRVSSKVLPGSPHEVLLVLDATTGQNALMQARTFNQAVKITGLVITKMDGSAKGGILIPIAGELGIPVKYVGFGEGVGDLVVFDPGEFARNLVG
jgi:fused signal recognition particle receptor